MAAGPIKFKPAVQIPGFNVPAEGIDITPTTVGEYIKAIYTFSVYAGSILAVVVLMIGGFMWLTSGGNVSQVGQARTYIGGAIAGFVLLLLSWTLLQMVNPRLVEFRSLVINSVENIPLPTSGCCVCEGATDDDNECDLVLIDTQNTTGMCECEVNGQIAPPTGVASEADCDAIAASQGTNCAFTMSSASSSQDIVLKKCQAKYPNLTCSVQTSRCNLINVCATPLIARGEAGWCNDDGSCHFEANFHCNNAYVCDYNNNNPLGTPLSVGSAPSAIGCCKPEGLEGDLCNGNSSPSECASGYECVSDSGFFTPKVGTCRRK
ncbi:hypothetical protein A3I40_00045 [Candidatus Uhrbacteria bacterium RIFCSPLOWO2_02_FULL_48_12]|uniref:Uncharacterized protein n=1 Tax=Candidatus Uhrbacteria bacterium RIFCSPLOWO2_02_FULL_48_12 TaxID=1802407 RepID=A0A1F7V6F5_9BACT|nr:MAG: hypothetical protein A3I40_00045 [Candidatus Uhrbacteria bacterium RIFCSPLOWO2_02_FULL_48_12]